MTSNYSEIEAKRRKNLEDNRRFLAALKLNDIRDQIKDIQAEEPETNRRPTTKNRDFRDNIVRRGSRQRKKIIEVENFSTDDEHPKKQTNIRKKKTDENRAPVDSKVKLALPEHMLTRYHSNGKRVLLHNHKATFADDQDE